MLSQKRLPIAGKVDIKYDPQYTDKDGNPVPIKVYPTGSVTMQHWTDLCYAHVNVQPKRVI